jgi:hypothetical protein
MPTLIISIRRYRYINIRVRSPDKYAALHEKKYELERKNVFYYPFFSIFSP